MNPKRTELSYRRAAVENASSAGLIIILYDLLIDDLRQAMNAIAGKDVEARSQAIKHAFLVLQQLEGSLDRENGGEAAENLSKFYAVMRGRIFEAHTKVSAEILKEQVALLLDVRQAWQQVDPTAPNSAAAPAANPTPNQSLSAAAESENETASWTA